MGHTVSTDQRFNRGFDKLTTAYCYARIEALDEMLMDPRNERRLDYLLEQKSWWESQLPYCYRREKGKRT